MAMDAGCDYIAYRWASAQIGGWRDSELDQQIREQTKGDPPFYGVVALAMMRADTFNLVKLQREWPTVFRESVARYNAPGALLSSDSDGIKRKVLGESYTPRVLQLLPSADDVTIGALGSYTIAKR